MLADFLKPGRIDLTRLVRTPLNDDPSLPRIHLSDEARARSEHSTATARAQVAAVEEEQRVGGSKEVLEEAFQNVDIP